MTVTVCIGSACHVKGSKQIVEQLQYLIKTNGLQDQVDLGGQFCMGTCGDGVCVKVDDQLHSINPQDTQSFFEKEILEKCK